MPRKKGDMFELSVTEFVLILAFVFLVLATVFQQEKNTNDADTAVITALIEELVKLTENWPGSDVVAPPNSAPDLQAKLQRLLDFIEEIDGQLQTPDDWVNLQWTLKLISMKNLSPEALRVLLEAGQACGNLRNKLTDCERKLTKCVEFGVETRKRCGTGYPLCTEKGQFLAELELLDDGIQVKVLTTVPLKSGAGFTDRQYDLKDFETVGARYLSHAQQEIPECRYQVKYIDRTSSSAKDWFKSINEVIDVPFYKLEIDK